MESHLYHVCSGKMASERKKCDCFHKSSYRDDCMFYRKETDMCDCLKAQTTKEELEEIDLEMYREQ